MSLGNISRLLFQTQQLPVLTVRFYSRWTHRNPARVILPFEPNSKVDLKKEKIIDLESETFKKTQEKHEAPTSKKNAGNFASTLSPEKSKEIKSKREDKLKKRQFYLSQKKVFDDNSEVIYEKLKENDSKVSSLLTNLKSKKERLRMKQMMVEGWRLIVDGLEAKCHLKYVIFSRVEELNNLRPFLPNTGVKFYKIPYKDIELFSDVETSPGIIGVFEMPTQDKVKRLAKPLPLHIICDNIRVPGNLGAILRAAVGAGCSKVLLSKGCVDVWDPKVVRSAAGAHFRLSIQNSIEWEDMPNILEENTSIFIADSNAMVLDGGEQDKFESSQIQVLPYYDVEYAALKHITLILGGETEGISEESYRLAASRNGLRLNIPLQKGIDSLNTGMAAAVIAFEIKKQLTQTQAKLSMEEQRAEAT